MFNRLRGSIDSFEAMYSESYQAELPQDIDKQRIEEAKRLRRKFRNRVSRALEQNIDVDYVTTDDSKDVYFFYIPDEIINDNGAYKAYYKQIEDLKDLMAKDTKFKLTISMDDEGATIYVTRKIVK